MPGPRIWPLHHDRSVPLAGASRWASRWAGGSDTPSSGLHLASNGKSGLMGRPLLSLAGSALGTMLMHGGLLSPFWVRLHSAPVTRGVRRLARNVHQQGYHLPRGSSIFHLTRVKESAGKADQQINEDISPSICGWNVHNTLTSQLQIFRGDTPGAAGP